VPAVERHSTPRKALNINS